MAVSRFAAKTPVANATGVAAELYLFDKQALVNVLASNLSGETEISIWTVPSGQDTFEANWIYLAKKIPLSNRNTLETFKIAVNSGDKVYASSGSGRVSFFVNGIYDKSGNTDVYVGETYVGEPTLGSIWIDTSDSPVITKYWNGTSFQPTGIAGPSVYNPVFSMQGSLFVSTGIQRFYVERSGIISYIRATIGTSPTGSPVVVDVLKNGLTTLDSPISIAPGETTLKGILKVSNISVSEGDYFTVNVDSVGSVTTGANLTVTLEIQ